MTLWDFAWYVCVFVCVFVAPVAMAEMVVCGNYVTMETVAWMLE